MTQAINDGFISQMSESFISRNDTLNRLGNLIATYQALPGLVGFWPISSKQRSTGNAYDLSGQNRTLTYTGNPVYDHENLIPFITLDGAGDYLGRLDETDLDITGIETNTAKPGLTIGGWFRTTASGADAGLIGKNIAQYQLTHHLGATVYFYINGSGNAVNLAAGSNVWNFIAARFTANTEMKIWVNNTSNIKTTGVPASITNTANAFYIGNSTSFYTGNVSMCFLCAEAVSDSIIGGLYQQSRVLFGV